jgi:hypothetical protein
MMPEPAAVRRQEIAVYLPDLFAIVPDDRAERWERLAALVEGWWSALTPADGVPEDELRTAEASLGIALPAALREAYARFGQRDEVTRSHETLLPPRRLRRKEGMLVVWVAEGTHWVIRESDLALPDPPVVLRERTLGVWHEHPALPSEPSVSRFFLWKALEHANEASRYSNWVYSEGDVEPVAAELGRRFSLLGFGVVERPPPATRLYGGEDVLIAVRPTEGIKLAAANLAAYRRAMDALHDLSLPWQCGPDEEAYRGEFHEQRQGYADMELLLRMAAKTGPLITKDNAIEPAPRATEERAPARPFELPGSDDRATGLVGDLDPRLGMHVDNALRPYAVLLPPGCVAHLREALEFVVETAPHLQAYVDALLGRPSADDIVVRRSGPPFEAKGLTPEQRDMAQAAVDSGLLDNIVGAAQRRMARSAADSERSGGETSEEDEAFDFEVTSIAEDAMTEFLVHVPTEAARDRDACEAELSRILRLGAASMFAGIAALLLAWLKSGKPDAERVNSRYLRALLVVRRMPTSGQDERVFIAYYVHRREIDEEAKRLGVASAEEYERHRAYLDRVASVVEAVAGRLERAGRGAYRAGEPDDIVATLLQRREGAEVE